MATPSDKDPIEAIRPQPQEVQCLFQGNPPGWIGASVKLNHRLPVVT